MLTRDNTTSNRKIKYWRQCLFRFGYKVILKPILFLFAPELIHDQALSLGAYLGKSRVARKVIQACFTYKHPALSQTIAGIHFQNPIGLAAGFDKNAELTQIIPEVGFGFAEIGSVTGLPCAGNPGQKLWRLKKTKSIVVNCGLNNVGAEVISQQLADLNFKIPIGISIAKANLPSTSDELSGIKDYVRAYLAFVKYNIGDYITINISCPNIYSGQLFLKPEPLAHLLAELETCRTKYNDIRPWFLKLGADLTPSEVDDIITIARRYHITGFICSNLTKNRQNKKIIDKNVPDCGSLSGTVCQTLSDNLISYIYTKTGHEFLIIGCGGIFSAEDAYRKIRLGASLLQLITGMIFEGPQLISEINYGLVRLLQKDGFRSISEAIGVDLYKNNSN